ncbi:fatty acyl-AMP ligase [Gynuella sp.]|uniref:fatty acyl-AMP ligase n=1 Tax=Gynuella sp. TaxID=2969146 RepID=UPI003D116663
MTGIEAIIRKTIDYDNDIVPSLDGTDVNTVVEALCYRAIHNCKQTAFVHLTDGEDNEILITYETLWGKARSIANLLEPYEPEGKRVLMLFETGIQYVAALFGIFLSRAVAVPSFPPVGSRALDRLHSIIHDAQPEIILVNKTMSRYRDRVLAEKTDSDISDHSPAWIEVDDLDLQTPKVVQDPDCFPNPEDLALIQYTSGSTSDPKGVLLTHANLFSNCRTASIWMGGQRHRIGCSWLPPYHDMGLMGGILQPIYEGFKTVLISPGHFVQRPLRWLQAISRFNATITIAPNFAFDLCVESITEAERSQLNLSTLEDIYCGAEPIRKATLDRFKDYFSPVGFHSKAFGPCYGMAESTVFVSGKPRGTEPLGIRVRQAALAEGRLLLADNNETETISLVSSGQAATGHTIMIVDPNTGHAVTEARIGEIWVQGPNVGAGYWQRANSKDAFGATIEGIEGTFLRTGDLGAIMGGELFVTGRLKDLIIIAGRNHYPQDLELSAQSADPRIRNNGVVAFSIEHPEHGEVLALAVEIQRNEKCSQAQLEEIHRAITAILVRHHGISPEEIHFCPTGTIPFTTSGKPQRQATKRNFLEGSLRCYVVSDKSKRSIN